MASVEVRAERADAEPGLTLLRAFEAEVASYYPGWDTSRKPTATPEEIAPPHGRFVVAYHAGDAVGCGALKRLDSAIGEIKRVYVAPQARGHGVARLLLAELEAQAQELGLERVRLDTGDRLPGAEALFRAAGYAEIGDYNGNPFAAFWFEKLLPRAQ